MTGQMQVYILDLLSQTGVAGLQLLPEEVYSSAIMCGTS